MASFSGSRYFISSIDDHSGYVSIQPLVQKSENFHQFKFFQALVESTNSRIRNQLLNDNGSEHFEFEGCLQEEWSKEMTAPPYSKFQNRLAD